MLTQKELLEKRAEELRGRLDDVSGPQLKEVEEELAIVQDQIIYESQDLSAEANYEDYLDYISD